VAWWVLSHAEKVRKACRVHSRPGRAHWSSETPSRSAARASDEFAQPLVRWNCRWKAKKRARRFRRSSEAYVPMAPPRRAASRKRT